MVITRSAGSQVVRSTLVGTSAVTTTGRDVLELNTIERSGCGAILKALSGGPGCLERSVPCRRIHPTPRGPTSV